MVAVYFDNSVLDPVATKHAGSAVRALMNSHNGLVHGSIQNVLEGWRIDDVPQRGQFIQTLLEVSATYEEEPILLEAARGLVDEIRVHHADWLVDAPDLSSQLEHCYTRSQVWKMLRKNPTLRPANFLARQQFLYQAIGESMDRQRLVRRARQSGIALPSPVVSIEIAVQLYPLVDALPEADAFWREGAAATWWRGAIEGDDDNLTDLRDYLRPYLAVDNIAVEPWMRFWLTEADAAALPIIRAEGLATFFQPDNRITAGNWGDINHAGSAVGRAFILTADHDYFEVLTNIHQQPNMAIAAPRFIQRDAPDIVAEIRTALGW
jgi:hypothetical protein